MKASKHTLTTLALAAAALATQVPITARALDAWHQVDEIPGATGQAWIRGSAGDIGVIEDQNGNGIVCSVGSLVAADEKDYATVRFSEDGGNTWSIWEGSQYSDDYFPYNHFTGFGAGGGRVYVCGQLYRALGESGLPESGWIVREWPVNGAWTTSDFFHSDEAPFSSCLDVKVAPWEDVYASGYTAQVLPADGFSPINESWVVRRRLSNAETFDVADTVLTSQATTKARAIGFFGTEGVIVVGQMRGLYNSYWTVRCSIDRGTTWETVDNLQTSDGSTGWLYGNATGVAVDRAGTISVVGSGGYKPASKNRTVGTTHFWLVRQSTDGGVTWETADSFSYGGLTVPLRDQYNSRFPGKPCRRRVCAQQPG